MRFCFHSLKLCSFVSVGCRCVDGFLVKFLGKGMS